MPFYSRNSRQCLSFPTYTQWSCQTLWGNISFLSAWVTTSATSRSNLSQRCLYSQKMACLTSSVSKSTNNALLKSSPSHEWGISIRDLEVLCSQRKPDVPPVSRILQWKIMMRLFSLQTIAQSLAASTRERWQFYVLALQTQTHNSLYNSMLSPFSTSQLSMSQS